MSVLDDLYDHMKTTAQVSLGKKSTKFAQEINFCNLNYAHQCNFLTAKAIIILISMIYISG